MSESVLLGMGAAAVGLLVTGPAILKALSIFHRISGVLQ